MQTFIVEVGIESLPIFVCRDTGVPLGILSMFERQGHKISVHGRPDRGKRLPFVYRYEL